MNVSIHRGALFIAALAAIVAVGAVLALDGYINARQQTPLPAAAVAAAAAPTSSAAGSPPPDVVYVRPAPSPQVIHVTQTAPPAPPKIVHVTVPGTGGGEGGGDGGFEHEGGNDD